MERIESFDFPAAPLDDESNAIAESGREITQSMTRTEFWEQFNSICAEYDAKVAAILGAK